MRMKRRKRWSEEKVPFLMVMKSARISRLLTICFFLFNFSNSLLFSPIFRGIAFIFTPPTSFKYSIIHSLHLSLSLSLSLFLSSFFLLQNSLSLYKQHTADRHIFTYLAELSSLPRFLLSRVSILLISIQFSCFFF